MNQKEIRGQLTMIGFMVITGILYLSAFYHR